MELSLMAAQVGLTVTFLSLNYVLILIIEAIKEWCIATMLDLVIMCFSVQCVTSAS